MPSTVLETMAYFRNSGHSTHILVVLLLSSILFCRTVIAQGDFSCDANRPCSNGACCGASGFCGYGDTYCGAGCQSQCDAHASCGKDALIPNATCPLNVCCSQFGFCGTTSDFCGTGCQNGCSVPTVPSSTGNSATDRVIGYYESWATTRLCSSWYPEQLDPTSYTHINFAFASIDGDSFQIIPASPSDVDLYSRTTSLKQINPDLKVFISVGGWAFNDPPTQNIFSNLAASSANRQSFIKSLLSFFQTYGFDGVDIDWEYPVAPERGGTPQDKENYVELLKDIRTAFDSSSGTYGLTITIPSSFWYLQNFDIVAMEPYLDWFNAMEYDLHGTWDGTDPFIGPVINAHSNLTEIDISFDLLWRNGINPSKVVMGLGFYGRSFELADPSCSTPGCAFSGPANAGACTGSPGTLSYSEIQDIIKANSVTPTWDHDAGVKYVVWGGNQWVSYDDKDTFAEKLSYANGKGIGGVMIWSADQDDSFGTALSSIVGKAPQFTQKSSQLAAAALGLSTGQICNVTDCGQTCSPGYTALSVTKGKLTQPTYNCKKNQVREICCPSSAVPGGCQWRGTAPFCDGKCHDGEVQLTQDKSGDGHSCWTGTKALCCPESTTADVLHQCTWFGTAPFCDGKCPSSGSGTTLQATTGAGGSGNGEYCYTGHKALCCPNPDPYTNCAWHGTAPFCNGKCPNGQVQLYSDSAGDGHTCLFSGNKVYCCDPPNTLVEPAVVQFENDLAVFAQSPTCDVTSEPFDRRRALTRTPKTLPPKPENDHSLEPRATSVDESTLTRLVNSLLPLLSIYFQRIGNQDALGLTPANLGMIDAFQHVSPDTFGNVSIEILSRRLNNANAISFPSDGPADATRAEVQDMFCEATDVNVDSQEILVADATECIGTAGVCTLPSTCGTQNEKRHELHHQHSGHFSKSRWITNVSPMPIIPRYFDQKASGASSSSGTNTVRPNIFDIVNTIVTGEVPLLEISTFNSGAPGSPDIQIEAVFDIRGHPQLAEFPEDVPPTGGFTVTRDRDQLLVIHFHLAEPSCLDDDDSRSRVNIRAMNMWHGQHAAIGINSDNVPYIEVGGRDKQKKKPTQYGANQRFKLFSCTPNNFWPLDTCINAALQDLPFIPSGNPNQARHNLIRRFIQYLIDQNILVWEGMIDSMWDTTSNSWFDDDQHRRGPRYGPGGGAAGGLNRGPSALTQM